MKWISVNDEMPPEDVQWVFASDSIDVLVTDGTRWDKAYFYFDEVDPGDSHWIQCGQDGYRLSFRPTHWARVEFPK